MKNLKFFIVMLLGLISFNIFSQQKQTKMENSEIIKKFLDGFNNPSKIQESIALLAEDYKFKNPMVTLNSKAEFIGLAQEMGKILTGLEINQIAESGKWVSVSYNFKSSIPGLENNLGTEWFRIENGIIKESYLIYDATEWRKVYAQIEEN